MGSHEKMVKIYEKLWMSGMPSEVYDKATSVVSDVASRGGISAGYERKGWYEVLTEGADPVKSDRYAEMVRRLKEEAGVDAEVVRQLEPDLRSLLGLPAIGSGFDVLRN